LILLVLVFGGLVAAGLPLLVGIISILGTFLALFVIGSITDVSIYSINLTTALGLGLAIDYSLFVVSRYREELRNGMSPHDAVVRSIETAGRTIAFSALTVAVSLSALLVFPLYFLRSFAYAGIAVVLTAMVTSLLSLPALLAVLGTKVNALSILRRDPKPEGTGFWYRVATAVMKRPVVVAVTVVAVLLVVGAPFLRVAFGQADDRALPTSAESRQVSETLRSEFAGNSGETFAVVIDGIGDPNGRADELGDFASDVSGLEGVAQVAGLTGVYEGGARAGDSTGLGQPYEQPTGTWLTVVPSIPLSSPEGEALVSEIRGLDPPFDVAVEGAAAELVDTKQAIADKLPLAAGIIVVSTFVLLFLLFGSLLVPLKAIVLNLLSLTATFGAMVWIFQDGNLSGVLDFTATGTLDVSMPVLMFCIAFGLSMDYEVFLLSRIKEEHDRTGDNERSVALGLERTGRIVTAAAVLLSVTFLAFATSGISFMKLFGIGLALAVLMDATIIRGLLVPAFMKLAGEANWWAPKPLRRFHDRFGVSESAAPASSNDRPAVDVRSNGAAREDALTY
jgi:RND superfamily putative drug exporter